MFAKTRTINRQYIGKNIKDFMEVPNLIAIQTSSYEDFLQADRTKKHEELLNQGLQEVFNSTFPIESPNGDMALEYDFYELAHASFFLFHHILLILWWKIPHFCYCQNHCNVLYS